MEFEVEDWIWDWNGVGVGDEVGEGKKERFSKTFNTFIQVFCSGIVNWICCGYLEFVSAYD